MKYDYAKHASYRVNKRFNQKKKNHWKLWLYTILTFIIFTLALVYLGKHHAFKIEQPTQNKIAIKTTKANKHKKENNNKKSAKIAIAKEASDQTASSPPTPQFDFYTLLPQKKIPIIVWQYELEIKTTENLEEAHKLKTKLIQLGYQPKITTSDINDTTLYQVTLGPFDNKTSALHFQKQLSKNKIACKLKALKNNNDESN